MAQPSEGNIPHGKDEGQLNLNMEDLQEVEQMNNPVLRPVQDYTIEEFDNDANVPLSPIEVPNDTYIPPAVGPI